MSKLTAGTANHLVATGENAAAVGTSIVTLFVPWIVAAILLIVIATILLTFAWRLFARKKRQSRPSEKGLS